MDLATVGPTTVGLVIKSLRTVGPTTVGARQMVHNIWAFKCRKEKTKGVTFGAEKIAEFWNTHVRTSNKTKSLCKKNTVDTCLTLHSRLLSIPGMEEIITSDERINGSDSFYNSLWRLQEIIYRCQKKEKIEWMMYYIDDGLHSGKFTAAELSVAALKQGSPRSVTDVGIMCYNLKNYLLGEWLDARDVPDHLRIKIREIFQNHHNMRMQWEKI